MIEKIKKYFDEYSLRARVYPSIIASLPLLLFLYLLFHDLSEISIIKSVLGSSVITIVLIYFFSDIARNLGKYTEQKIFHDEIHFPTTELLLHVNKKFSKEKRAKIYEKIRTDFNLELASLEEERRDENAARQSIKEAVGLIRQEVADGRLVLQFNIRYGFWRNLIGISFFPIICSIVGMIFYLIQTNITNFFIFSISTLLYLAIFVYRKTLLQFFGFQYAEQLFLEYLKRCKK